MALKTVDISKGVYLDVDPTELASTEYAAILKNLLLGKGGSNVDRPDFTQYGVTGAAYGLPGAFQFKGFAVFVSEDRKIWSQTSAGVVTEITGASPLAGTARPTFDDDGDFLAIAGGGAPKVWSGATAATACIDMPGSPPDLTFISYLDGYWMGFKQSTQEVYFAGPTAAARLVWNANDFFSAEGRPDIVHAQRVLFREYYAFGPKSMEVFQNFGDSLEPFKPTFFITRGTAAPYSVVEADNTLFFLDHESHFVRLDGRTPVFISEELDRVLKAPSFDVSDCWGTRIEIDGHYLIAWVFPNMKRCFVYEYRQKQWFDWESYIDGVPGLIQMHSHVYMESWKRHLVGHPTTGTINEFTKLAKGTAAAPLRRVRRTGHYDHGMGGRKRSNYYLIHLLRGLSTPGSTEEFFEISVNDDGKGWNTKQVGFGYPGEKQEPIRVRMGGIYRKRQLEILTTAPVDFRLIKIEEDVEAMTS